MGQRQFSENDTSKWLDGFGIGKAGNLVISSSATWSNLANYFAGNSGAYSGYIGGSANWVAGDLVIIWQTRGYNANSSPNWELNKIVSVSGSTVVLKYPLTREYRDASDGDSANDCAQIVRLIQYKNFTINSGVTLTCPAWNGGNDGIIPILASATFTLTGSISLSSKGFDGGDQVGGAGNNTGEAGEGHPAAGTVSVSANGNGGGGGSLVSDSNRSGGGGGGNGTDGGYGLTSAGANHTAPGVTAGNDGLTTLVMGGGGGQGGFWVGNATVAGNGAAILLVIAKSISITGTILGVGQAGANATYDGAAGGGGAGGSVLLKGQTVAIGTDKMDLRGGAGGALYAGRGGAGGAGGKGRVAIYYKDSLAGSLSSTYYGTYSATQEDGLYEIGGAGILTSEFI